MNLIQIFQKFPTQESCVNYLESKRWPKTVICPYCGSDNNYPRKNDLRHHCNNCLKSFSVTVKTIFHDTRIPLQKWFLAISLIINAKKGISARQLGRDLQVTKDTAWRMAKRIREGMKNDSQLLQGIIEMDETYIGGKARKGKKYDNNDDKPKRGRGTKKTPVIGMVERNGKVKAQKISKSKLKSYTQELIKQRILEQENKIVSAKKELEKLKIEIYLDEKHLSYLKNELSSKSIPQKVSSFFSKKDTLTILINSPQKDGLILNEIAKKYKELGISFDPRIIFSQHIEPLINEGLVEQTNPDAKRSRRYRAIIKDSISNNLYDPLKY